MYMYIHIFTRMAKEEYVKFNQRIMCYGYREPKD